MKNLKPVSAEFFNYVERRLFLNMGYVIAAFHDLGLVNDREKIIIRTL